MKVRRSRIESDLHDERAAERQAPAQVVEPDDVGAALSETVDLLVNGPEWSRTPYYKTHCGWVTAPLGASSPPSSPSL